MLLPDFYNIKQIVSEGNTHTVAVRLNKQHPIYNGHFPCTPVTPGVCTLQVIKECAQEIIGYPLTTCNVASCKFVGMIIPDKHSDLAIRITLDKSEELWNCRAEVASEEAVLLKLVICHKGSKSWALQ